MILREPIQDKGERFDWPLFIATIVIATVGVVNLISATSVYTQARGELWVSQLYFLIAGAAVSALVVVIDYRHIERFAYVLYTIGIFSLMLVFVLSSICGRIQKHGAS